LSFFANVSLDSDEVRRSTGRLFQVAGPATAKSLRPIVVLVCGTTSAPLFADRSCHLPTTDETVCVYCVYVCLCGSVPGIWGFVARQGAAWSLHRLARISCQPMHHNGKYTTPDSAVSYL